MNCTKTQHTFVAAEVTDQGQLPPSTRCECGRYLWGQVVTGIARPLPKEAK